ncbi:4Fe-4S binding protein [Candidatus Entotheonella palauensis]|uniref:4Fe-4S binding protein n=1 Tax=Candidatus Entotheonella palauensis TaxID=93172 RepID=UPI000B7F779F|nr:4Fe-4S binding protein [Candidatus Entotheonella palauensis]
MKIRMLSTRLLRRGLQVAVVAFVIYAALGASWRNYKVAHNHRRLVSLMQGEVWGTLYGVNEDALVVLGEPYEASLKFLGMSWAARVFGINTADPILVISHALRNRSLPMTLLVSLIAPVLLALFMGKVFCSHLCPARLLFDIAQGLRSGLQRLGIELPAWRSEIRLGGYVLLGGLLASMASSTAVWLFILPYVSFSGGLFLLITSGTGMALLTVALGWFAVDLGLAPGYFCHNLCPTGFLLEQLGRFSVVKLRKKNAEVCPPSCNLCQRACPYDLRPSEGLHLPACNNCGACVTACPSNRLGRQVALPVLSLVLLALPITAVAHHNKGMPHYGYYENYAQTPTEEFAAVDGKWEIGATIFNFQGLDRRAADTPNDVKIYLYLYDTEADVSYQGPLNIEIRQRSELIARFERHQVDEEAVYSTRETLPRSGDYELVAEVAGDRVTLPFHVDLAADAINWWVVGGIPTVGVWVIALLLYGRSRPRRRRKPTKRVAAKMKG